MIHSHNALARSPRLVIVSPRESSAALERTESVDFFHQFELDPKGVQGMDGALVSGTVQVVQWLADGDSRRNVSCKVQRSYLDRAAMDLFLAHLSERVASRFVFLCAYRTGMQLRIDFFTGRRSIPYLIARTMKERAGVIHHWMLEAEMVPLGCGHETHIFPGSRYFQVFSRYFQYFQALPVFPGSLLKPQHRPPSEMAQWTRVFAQATDK